MPGGARRNGVPKLNALQRQLNWRKGTRNRVALFVSGLVAAIRTSYRAQGSTPGGTLKKRQSLFIRFLTKTR